MERQGIDGVDAAVNTLCCLWGSHRIVGYHSPQAGAELNLPLSGCTGGSLDQKKAELKPAHTKYIREAVI